MDVPPPDDAPCWAPPLLASWGRPAAADEMWLLAAVLRTVDTLPRLHPWRLGGTEGSRRVLAWCGQPQESAEATTLRPTPPGHAVLSAAAREPDLDTSDSSDTDGFSDLLRSTTPTNVPPPTRWAGSVVRLPGAWLPPLAVLPRQGRGFDDPATAWRTESVDFDARRSVHAADVRFAADLLAPHVMALVLDEIPDRAAVTLSGDALHVWWEHEAPLRDVPSLVAHMIEVAAALAAALPSFLLSDHPDHSGAVEADLEAKAEAAREYREHRQLGRSTDPVLQRIYDQARATYTPRDVSSPE